jgi:hypothetical protein
MRHRTRQALDDDDDEEAQRPDGQDHGQRTDDDATRARIKKKGRERWVEWRRATRCSRLGGWTLGDFLME